MEPIASYVFLDLETTGLPAEECNKTKITELSLIAVKRSHILQASLGNPPRVQQKLTLCFNPRKMVHPVNTKITGLCNDLLEYEAPFNHLTFETINGFLNLLTKPVCLIAQNGLKYDYPILKRQLINLGVSFSDGLKCADCLHAFFDILNEPVPKVPSGINLGISFCDDLQCADSQHAFCDIINEPVAKDPSDETLSKEEQDELCLSCEASTLDMQKQNEVTPKKSSCSTTNSRPVKNKYEKGCVDVSKVSRTLFWGDKPKPDKSYKLKNIHTRLTERPYIKAHRAENDCIMALECAVVISKEFVQWVDENNCLFADVKPMTIGVPLGC